MLRGRGLVGLGALAVVAAVVVCGAMLARDDTMQETQTPEQVALLQMWERPYVSTVVPAQRTEMLWNAASDDPSEDMHSSQGGDSDGGSASYMKYDTFGLSSGSDSGESSDLSKILPSSELSDGGSSGGSHEWDTSKLSDNDDWDQHSGDSSWGKGSSTSGVESQAWLKQHSWDSGKDIKLKQELKKMYHKGINAISKSIASEAAEENNNSFFSKWAGKKGSSSLKMHGKHAPLNNKDMQLYKEAESSVKKEEMKKKPLINAVHEAAAKIASSSTPNVDKDQAKDHEIKAKLQAADRLSASLAANKAKKTSVKELLKESAKIAQQSKNAHSAADKKAVAANAKRLQQEIVADFSHATAIADHIKTTADKLVGSKLKAASAHM